VGIPRLRTTTHSVTGGVRWFSAATTGPTAGEDDASGPLQGLVSQRRAKERVSGEGRA
jgi:hypothetical protein